MNSYGSMMKQASPSQNKAKFDYLVNKMQNQHAPFNIEIDKVNIIPISPVFNNHLLYNIQTEVQSIQNTNRVQSPPAIDSGEKFQVMTVTKRNSLMPILKTQSFKQGQWTCDRQMRYT